MSEVRLRGPRKGNAKTSRTEEVDVSKDRLNLTQKESVGSWKGALDWTAMLVVLVYGAYMAHYFGARVLPDVKSAEVAGLRGFSEERAFKHVTALTKFGPHPVGSDALEHALEYVLSQVKLVESAAGPGVDVEISQFVASGYNRLEGGLFFGRTLVYSNLKSIVVRVSPKSSATAEENALLVSSHVDTVVTTAGAGDCSSCVAVMLELLRALSHRAHMFRHSVIFVFNTGEEEGLDGAHSFITQHPWRNSVRAFIDLESMGVGGKSNIFQAPDQWLLETFAKVAPHPALKIAAQDVFHSGFIKSATDFQVYREVAGLSGLDFAFMENGHVYHTKNDKIDLLRSGSLQHSGDNVLAFLVECVTSQEFETVPKHNATELQSLDSKMNMVYFDILGKYAVTYTRDFARVLNTSVIMQVLLILSRSIYPGGLPALISLSLALFTMLLTWASSIVSVVFMSFLIPHLSSHAIPYIASPWLSIGLFGSPAVLGALIGNWLGRTILVNYIVKARRGQSTEPSIEWEAERWLYKAGLLQWIIILALGNWVGAGLSYLAVSWVLCPAAAYGLLNYHSPGRQPQRQLSLLSFWVGVIPPTILSATDFFMLPQFLISNLVRFDRDPGSSPDWLGNMLVAVVISTIICLWLVYLWPFAHRRGGIKWILGGCLLIAAGAVLLVFYQIFPPFTDDIGRAVNVVQVVETSEGHIKSYISLSAHTPGKFEEELKRLEDLGLVCEKGGPDLVTYSVNYGCSKALELDPSLLKERPSLVVEGDEQLDGVRTTSVAFHAASAHRWFAAINAEKIGALSIESTDVDENSQRVHVPTDKIIGVGGWHYVQFASDQNGPHSFLLKLVWGNVSSTSDDLGIDVIKVRTDVNIVRREVATVLEKFPEWVLFGKSTCPYNLAFLDKLTVSSLSSSG